MIFKELIEIFSTELAYINIENKYIMEKYIDYFLNYLQTEKDATKQQSISTKLF